ncbi:MAG: endospore germination permease [Alicyclobacillaceae bacterium]|jgi:spore germination protein|nr:endospore germination permease [Alicyclobacillaceae bacterium]MCY0896266.1 endospore germination permease [Alicyclobacillaceae bacterium]
MQKPKSVTSLQLTLTTGTAIIGVGILAFPRIVVEYVDTGAPMAAFFAIALMALGSLVLCYLGNAYPEQTLFEYADNLLGRTFNRIVLAVLGVYFLELTALASREFGEVVITSVLQHTPITVTVMVMVLLATVSTRNDIGSFARILSFYMPLVYFPALVIVVLSLKSARLVNIMPVLGMFHRGSGWDAVIAVLIVAALYQNYLVVGLLLPFMYRIQSAWKSTLIGMFSAGAIYIIIMFAVLSVFGFEEIKNLTWPTLELAKTAALPAAFIERLDPIFLAVWVTAVFCAIFAAYFIAINALSHVFRLQDHRALSLAVFPIIFELAAQPSNIVDLYRIIKTVGLSGLVLSLGYPFLLAVLHVLRRAHPAPSSKRRRAKST